MSTRSIVAVAEGDGWKGQYHHSDGYPTGMGACLWLGLKDKSDDELAAFFDTLNAHTSGWSEFQLRGDNGPTGVYLDTGRCYCHWEGREETFDNTRTAEQPFGFREEYLYVISLHTRKMFIYDTHDEYDRLIGTADLQPDADEPDWELIEDKSREIINAKYAEVA